MQITDLENQVSNSQQQWLNKYAGGEQYQFTSHGSSRECIEEDVDNLYSLLMQFDLKEADKLWQQAQDCFESLCELDEEKLTEEVRVKISEDFQELYEILFAFEDAIHSHAPEGMYFGVNESSDYGFWLGEDED